MFASPMLWSKQKSSSLLSFLFLTVSPDVHIIDSNAVSFYTTLLLQWRFFLLPLSLILLINHKIFLLCVPFYLFCTVCCFEGWVYCFIVQSNCQDAFRKWITMSIYFSISYATYILLPLMPLHFPPYAIYKVAHVLWHYFFK